jgi:hypothetical protein
MLRTYRFIADGSGTDTVGVVRDLDPATLQAQRARYGGNAFMMSGTTAQRPRPSDGDFAGASNILRGTIFLDTALGYCVVADGAGNWLNPATGSKV